MFHIASTQEPPTLPADISEDFRSFLMLCFQRNPKERPTAKALLEHSWLTSVKDSPHTTPTVTAAAHKTILEIAVPKMGEPDKWFDFPREELPPPSKPPVPLPKHSLASSNEAPGLAVAGMGQNGITTYLTDMLQQNEKQLSGDFRQSLRLLINKPKRTKRRGIENPSPQNSSAEPQHSVAMSPVVRHDDQPITSSYARQMQKEQDERQAQNKNQKQAKQREWEEELEQASGQHLPNNL